MTTLNDVHTYDAAWRSILENKGYTSVHFDVKFEPVNDEVRISMWWSNTEWSSTHLPNDMSKCNRFELGTLLQTIDKFVKQQPLESEAREAKLVEDFARIKERIAASRYADLFEAEMQALMDRLTSNVLEDKRVVQMADARADGEGEGQPF